jgi:hypothetical protein
MTSISPNGTQKTSPPAPLHMRGELLIFSFLKSFFCGEGFRLRFKRRFLRLKKPHPWLLSTGEGSF